MTEDMDTRLRLSIQGALLRVVTPSLRAVAAKYEENLVSTRFIIDGEISDEMQDNYSCAAAEIIADFSSPCKIKDSYERIDAPCPLKIDIKEGWFWAYMRNESE